MTVFSYRLCMALLTECKIRALEMSHVCTATAAAAAAALCTSHTHTRGKRSNLFDIVSDFSVDKNVLGIKLSKLFTFSKKLW